MMKNSVWMKFFIVCSLGLAGVSGLVYYRSQQSTSVIIRDFNEQRDSQAIHDLMKKNWYWLISSKDYSVDFMLKNRAPNHYEPQYFGKLIIKTLYKNGTFIGFIAYYKKSLYQGQILFLAVDSAFRGHSYGLKLVNYAVDDLVRLGATRVELPTRTTNLPAQSVYLRAGFREMYRTDSGFVYFEKVIIPTPDQQSDA